MNVLILRRFAAMHLRIHALRGHVGASAHLPRFYHSSPVVCRREESSGENEEGSELARSEGQPQDTSEPESTGSSLFSPAWALNALAGVIETTSSVLNGTIRTGASVADTAIRTTAHVSTAVMPKLVHDTSSDSDGDTSEGESVEEEQRIARRRAREKVIPHEVEELVVGGAETARAGARFMKEGIGSITGFGVAAGSAMAGVVKSGVGSVLPRGGAPQKSSPTMDALMRLNKAAIGAFTNTLDSIDDSTKVITRSGRSAIGDVSTHVLGKQAGRLVDEAMSASEEVMATYKAIHGINAQKVAKKFGKAAGKTAIKEVFAQEKLPQEQLVPGAGVVTVAQEETPASAEHAPLTHHSVVVDAGTVSTEAQQMIGVAGQSDINTVEVDPKYSPMLEEHDAAVARLQSSRPRNGNPPSRASDD